MSRIAYWVAYTHRKPKTLEFGVFVSGFDAEDELVETRHTLINYPTEAEAVEAAKAEKHKYSPTPFSVAGVADTDMQPLEVFQPEEVEFASALKAGDDEKEILTEAAKILQNRAVGIRLWERYTHADSDDVARLLRACAK